MYAVNVNFDSNTNIPVENVQFEYKEDPVVTSTDPTELKSISR